MKQLIFFFSTISILLAEDINIIDCKSCHGMEFEKKALGKSKVVKDMSKADITKALIGYKEGTYGGSMKNIMENKVKNYSKKQLKELKIK